MRRVKHEKVSKYPNRACALNGSGCSEIFAGKVNKNKREEKISAQRNSFKPLRRAAWLSSCATKTARSWAKRAIGKFCGVSSRLRRFFGCKIWLLFSVVSGYISASFKFNSNLSNTRRLSKTERDSNWETAFRFIFPFYDCLQKFHRRRDYQSFCGQRDFFYRIDRNRN